MISGCPGYDVRGKNPTGARNFYSGNRFGSAQETPRGILPGRVPSLPFALAALIPLNQCIGLAEQDPDDDPVPPITLVLT